MRIAALALTAAALLSATACGSSGSPAPKADPAPSSAFTTPGQDVSTPSPTPSKTVDAEAGRTTLKDAATYAAALEQVFFSSGYPKDLAGAVRAAKELDLQLAPGNTIASYVFNDADQEFQLCVENTSGAYSTYDTRPMSTIKSGDAGGCP